LSKRYECKNKLRPNCEKVSVKIYRDFFIYCHKLAPDGVYLLENASLAKINTNSGEIKIMIKSVNIRFIFYTLLLTVVCLSGANVFAQNKTQEREFCSSNNTNYWGDKVTFKELRESTIRPGNLLTVDGRQNGGISVRGSDRSDILIRACVQAWDTSEQAARERAKNVRIETAPVVRAEGVEGQSNTSVSYQILVPRNTNLKLTAHNGGIAISNVEGSMEFTTTNGGVSLSEVAGDVRGKTTNGGVSVKLAGNRWQGRGLDVETTNGGVNLVMPQNYAARLETRTVNGGFRSDFELNVRLREWNRGVNISTDLNGGGAPIRVVTTNGGVRISSASNIR
jgi:hypothetical protein